jgi:tetratricopeptide (TPR) repeat protein
MRRLVLLLALLLVPAAPHAQSAADTQQLIAACLADDGAAACDALIADTATPPFVRLAALMMRISRQLDAGQRDEVERGMAAAAALAGDDATMNRAVADAYGTLGLHAEAAAHWDRVVIADPSDMESLASRAHARSDARQLAGALADFEEVLRRDPDDTEAHIGKAVVLIRMGDRAAAGRLLDQILTDHPTDSLALLNRASNDLATGNFRRAAADADAALARDPDLAWLHATACIARWRLAEPEPIAACARTEALIAADPDDIIAGWPWNALAGRALAAGHPDRALVLLGQALHRFPREGIALYLRGIARIRLGQDGAPDLAAGLRHEPLAATRMQEFFGPAIGPLP